jgi:hypothetical protein
LAKPADGFPEACDPDFWVQKQISDIALINSITLTAIIFFIFIVGTIRFELKLLVYLFNIGYQRRKTTALNINNSKIAICQIF